MFDKIKGHLNENFDLGTPEEILDESMDIELGFDFVLEEGVDEGQFPTIIDSSAPDEIRDIDGAEDTVSINDLDYDDEDDEDDLGLDELDDEDLDELSDKGMTDLNEINEEEEEDEMVEDIINESLDNILLNEEEEIDIEIDELLEEACKSKKEEVESEEDLEEACKSKKEEVEDEESLDESFEFGLFSNLLEGDEIELDDDLDDDEEDEYDDLEDGELLLDEI